MDNENNYNYDENNRPEPEPKSDDFTNSTPPSDTQESPPQQESYQRYHYDQSGYGQGNSHSNPDYQQNYDSKNQQNSYLQPEPNGFATASLVLGILSLILCCCCYVSVPLGALGIIFAILSKGASIRMSGRSKTGLGLSIAGLCITLLLTASIFFGGFLYGDKANFNRQFKDYMEYYLGDEYDSEELDDLFRQYMGDDYNL